MTTKPLQFLATVPQPHRCQAPNLPCPRRKSDPAVSLFWFAGCHSSAHWKRPGSSRTPSCRLVVATRSFSSARSSSASAKERYRNHGGERAKQVLTCNHPSRPKCQVTHAAKKTLAAEDSSSIKMHRLPRLQHQDAPSILTGVTPIFLCGSRPAPGFKPPED